MTTLFGIPVEPNFNLAKDNRTTRLGWCLGSILAVVVIWDLAGLPFDTQLAQGLFASALFYGATFYVDRGAYFRTAWFFKAILATLPIHLLYLALLYCADLKIPKFMPIRRGFIAMLVIGYVIERSVAEPIIKRIEPRDLPDPNAPTTEQEKLTA